MRSQCKYRSTQAHRLRSAYRQRHLTSGVNIDSTPQVHRTYTAGAHCCTILHEWVQALATTETAARACCCCLRVPTPERAAVCARCLRIQQVKIAHQLTRKRETPVRAQPNARAESRQQHDHCTSTMRKACKTKRYATAGSRTAVHRYQSGRKCKERTVSTIKQKRYLHSSPILVQKGKKYKAQNKNKIRFEKIDIREHNKRAELACW